MATDDTTRRRRWPWMLGALCAALVLLAILFDWNWLRGPIASHVTAVTGREFAIEGDLDVDLGRVTTIRAERLRFANADWADEAQMATLERLEVAVRVWSLLRGTVDLPRLHLQRPRVLIERNGEGQGNWTFMKEDPEPKEAGDPPRVGLLTVADGELRVHEPALKTDLRLDFHSGEASADGAPPPVVAHGEGRYRGHPFELAAQVDSPLELQAADAQYRIDLKATAGATQAQLDGTLLSPLQLQDFDLHFALSGNTLADLYPLLGVALPQTPPYALDGRIGRDGTAWHYRDFTGRVGDSDLAGNVSIDVTGARPRFIAQLASKRLDLDDLGGFIGATPSTDDGETASAAQQREAAARAASPRVLPDAPYDLAKLRAMDADVRLRVDALAAPGLPLESMDAHLLLDDGLLRLDPIEVGVAGGALRSTLRLNARENPIEVDAVLQARDLQLPKLVPGAEILKDAVGRIGGNASLRTRGNSVAQMLGGANGELGVAMGSGRISALLVELAGLDIAEGLRYLVGKDRDIRLRCAYADFSVEDGVMKTRALALDTSDTALHGEGSIDLGEEQLALRLIPEPKDRSPLTLRTPLKVGGTFKSPRVRPEAGPLVLRTAAAAGLFAIAPPAALLALIETGPGEDVQCRGST
jgi:uncharacterized protein involved in outer membrane biogenesis